VETKTIEVNVNEYKVIMTYLNKIVSICNTNKGYLEFNDLRRVGEIINQFDYSNENIEQLATSIKEKINCLIK
jgi:hypothetical protein